MPTPIFVTTSQLHGSLNAPPEHFVGGWSELVDAQQLRNGAAPGDGLTSELIPIPGDWLKPCHARFTVYSRNQGGPGIIGPVNAPAAFWAFFDLVAKAVAAVDLDASVYSLIGEEPAGPNEVGGSREVPMNVSGLTKFAFAEVLAIAGGDEFLRFSLDRRGPADSYEGDIDLFCVKIEAV